MALKSTSLFLYGYSITTNNQMLDFKISGGGLTLTAIVPTGYYTLTQLMSAVVTALQSADTANTYTVTADRTNSGGLQNRVTISTSNSYLSMLFASGPNTLYTIASVLGFSVADQTGATTYTGSSSTGTALQTNWWGFSYTPPDAWQESIGNINMATSGNRETINYSTQKYVGVQYKYIPYANMVSQWSPLFQWLQAGKPCEFTPEYTTPGTFYQVWHEGNVGSGKGMGFKMVEMVSAGLIGLYDTGMLKLRLIPS